MCGTTTRRRLFTGGLAAAGGLVAATVLPERAAAAVLCPYCGVAPFGPLHAYLHRTSPSPAWSDVICARESGWNPAAKNPRSSAAGLFQFLDWVWYDWLIPEGLAHGSPYDPYAAIDAHAACLRRGYYWMWAATG